MTTALTARPQAGTPASVRLPDNALELSLEIGFKLEPEARARLANDLRAAAASINVFAPGSVLTLNRNARMHAKRRETYQFFARILGEEDAATLGRSLRESVTGFSFRHCPRDRYVTLFVDHD